MTGWAVGVCIRNLQCLFLLEYSDLGGGVPAARRLQTFFLAQYLTLEELYQEKRSLYAASREWPAPLSSYTDIPNYISPQNTAPESK